MDLEVLTFAVDHRSVSIVTDSFALGTMAYLAAVSSVFVVVFGTQIGGFIAVRITALVNDYVEGEGIGS